MIPNDYPPSCPASGIAEPAEIGERALAHLSWALVSADIGLAIIADPAARSPWTTPHDPVLAQWAAVDSEAASTSSLKSLQPGRGLCRGSPARVLDTLESSPNKLRQAEDMSWGIPANTESTAEALATPSFKSSASLYAPLTSLSSRAAPTLVRRLGSAPRICFTDRARA
ncbi:hypothetical protein NLJ89_g4650 [Agrocybe chaxingu]|uniref:Uncharacterized protein n=1 Tax=Agrocybe chaxingu TaxID=84603 RepID=A0A9W8K1P3_9AGAR|nr:hypothetical protein NLJ89_g4650 [Agrocybe chaxingu]